MRAKLVVLAVLALVTVACADAPTGARSDPAAQDTNTLTPWTSDGRRYGIAFRPLLPDQHDC